MRNKPKWCSVLLLGLVLLLATSIVACGEAKPVLTQEEEEYLDSFYQSMARVENASGKVCACLHTPGPNSTFDVPAPWTERWFMHILGGFTMIELEYSKWTDIKPPRSMIDLHARYYEALLHLMAADVLTLEATEAALDQGSTEIDQEDLDEIDDELNKGLEILDEVYYLALKKEGIKPRYRF